MLLIKLNKRCFPSVINNSRVGRNKITRLDCLHVRIKRYSFNLVQQRTQISLQLINIVVVATKRAPDLGFPYTAGRKLDTYIFFVVEMMANWRGANQLASPAPQEPTFLSRFCCFYCFFCSVFYCVTLHLKHFKGPMPQNSL